MPLRRLIRQIVKAIALQSDIKACVITIHKIRAGYYERVIHAVLDVFTYLVKQPATKTIQKMLSATPKSCLSLPNGSNHHSTLKPKVGRHGQI
jgi:hypothetical protein